MIEITTPEQAIEYLKPIADTTPLVGLRDSLNMAIEALKTVSTTEMPSKETSNLNMHIHITDNCEGKEE